MSSRSSLSTSLSTSSSSSTMSTSLASNSSSSSSTTNTASSTLIPSHLITQSMSSSFSSSAPSLSNPSRNLTIWKSGEMEDRKDEKMGQALPVSTLWGMSTSLSRTSSSSSSSSSSSRPFFYATPYATLEKIKKLPSPGVNCYHLNSLSYATPYATLEKIKKLPSPGVKCYHLNRLWALPLDLIKGIIPDLFTEVESWKTDVKTESYKSEQLIHFLTKAPQTFHTEERLWKILDFIYKIEWPKEGYQCLLIVEMAEIIAKMAKVAEDPTPFREIETYLRTTIFAEEPSFSTPEEFFLYLESLSEKDFQVLFFQILETSPEDRPPEIVSMLFQRTKGLTSPEVKCKLLTSLWKLPLEHIKGIIPDLFIEAEKMKDEQYKSEQLTYFLTTAPKSFHTEERLSKIDDFIKTMQRPTENHQRLLINARTSI